MHNIETSLFKIFDKYICYFTANTRTYLQLSIACKNSVGYKLHKASETEVIYGGFL